MSRSVRWRREASDLVSWSQDQALNTTMYILRQFGPTGFMLQEEGQRSTVKVLLGDPHHCSCQTFCKEKDLCKHICWLLLKKFRLPREHEYAFQVGLVAREIVELLSGLHHTQAARPANTQPTHLSNVAHAGSHASMAQKDIGINDICPICQEEFFKRRLPVTYCRHGCGNSVHISCMKMWADHQTREGDDGSMTLSCPLCRECFGTYALLQEEANNAEQLITAAERVRLHIHSGIACHHCQMRPIQGTCYRCAECMDIHLCQECFLARNHFHHMFVFRKTRSSSWCPVQTECGQLLPSVKHQRTNAREQGCTNAIASCPGEALQESALASLPILSVGPRSRLMAPGRQCRVCLRSFRQGQHVRPLPCRHMVYSTVCGNQAYPSFTKCDLAGNAFVRWYFSMRVGKCIITELWMQVLAQECFCNRQDTKLDNTLGDANASRPSS
ncbi:E3 ubiquitin-protein ligase ZSWIM2 isoform X2 [Lethenteron reissneri]|uniref:E3 ubiquitin-protein ligase ZSWIM2 isoform X2 n=1 Tax=Lethenteron reissneri TaxID=7753 RepID=UPI002AB7096D|nr:E3 ubiquitin-protein ligase ZSWIM2 isoform X2 [Lethenteron reissneri]